MLSKYHSKLYSSVAPICKRLKNKTVDGCWCTGELWNELPRWTSKTFDRQRSKKLGYFAKEVQGTIEQLQAFLLLAEERFRLDQSRRGWNSSSL